MAFTKEKPPQKVEGDLMALFPVERCTLLSHMLKYVPLGLVEVDVGLYRYEIDCARGNSKLLAFTLYKDDEILVSRTIPASDVESEDPLPESIGELVDTQICRVFPTG